MTIGKLLLLLAGSAVAVRAAIGAGTSSYADPLTTNGDLVVRSGGATTRLGAAGAPDGGALTVVNGAPTWAAVSSSPTTTRGDMIVRGASADERVALGTTGYVWTAGATDPGWSAPTAVDPTDALPSPSSVVLYLRPQDIADRDGEQVFYWRPTRGSPWWGQNINGAAALWNSSALLVAGTSGGVREIVCNGGHRGQAAVLPASGAGAWTVAVIVRNAQLTGSDECQLGFGGNGADTHGALCSRAQPGGVAVSQWTWHTNVYSAPTNAAYMITSASYPSTADATLALARYNGTTLELLVGTAGSGSMASVGTRTVTLNIGRDLPLSLCANATGNVNAGTGSIRTVVAWSARLDDTAVGQVYTYVVAQGWL